MKPQHVMIIARQDTLRGGLVGLIEAIPGVGVIDQVQSGEEAMQQAELTTPNLLILDMYEGSLDVFTTLKELYPGMKSLLLVDDMRQQTRAQVAGADVALIKGYPAQELVETVQALLKK